MTDLVPRIPPWQAKLPFFYGWIIAGVACSGTFVQGSYYFSLSILSVSMAGDLGWSRSALFLPLTVRGLMAALVAPAVGHLVDRPNGARVLVVVGGLLSAGSLALIGRVEHEWQFLFLFGIMGGLSNIGHPLIVATAVLPKWFLRLRGRAMAVATAGPGLAALITPLGTAFFDDQVGWRETWLIFAAVTFCFTVLPGLLVRRQPEDVELKLDGASALESPGASRAPAEISFTARQAFRTATAWLLLAAHSLAFVSILVLPVVFVPLFVDRGFTKAEAAAALIPYGIAALLARAGWGFLVDRIGVRRTAIALACYAAFAISLLIPDVSNAGWMFILGTLVGYASGGIMVVNLLLWPTYFGRAHLGTINGVVSPVTSVASSTAPYVVALIFDLSGSYTGGLLLLVSSWLLALLPLALVRPARRPNPVDGPIRAIA